MSDGKSQSSGQRDFFKQDATLQELFGELKGVSLLEAIWAQYQASCYQTVKLEAVGVGESGEKSFCAHCHIVRIS